MTVPFTPPFIREMPPQTRLGLESLGFESVAPPPDAAQKHRAVDLFLRGVLTENQMRTAAATVVGFEAIIGKADYLPAVFLESGVAVSRATCLIRTSGADYLGRTGSWNGTGFLVANNVLLTNHHVLNSKEVAAAGTCVFNYQATASGEPALTKNYRIRPDLFFITSPAVGGLDYTFVWVDGDPGHEFGTAPINRDALAIAPNEYANVVSHPGGRLKVISIKENEVKWQDDLVVHYASDTEPGSSGAPVHNNNWQLVALHHASKESTIPDFPVLNEGIKLSAIAADLERRARANTAESPVAARALGFFGGTDEHLGFFGMAGRRQPDGAKEGLEQLVDSYQGTEQDIDIGFWNVEWLSNRYEEKAAAVAQVIHDMKLDIWCLEESSPNGVAAVVEVLRNTYGLRFAFSAAEPQADDQKQSCTLVWNQETITGEKISWGEPIETWLQAHSRNFDDLGLEAVHGKIFDRYPALFYFKTVAPTPSGILEFHLVPLHLKAKDEGSLRRRMASKILAAAIKQRISEGHGPDYIIGGDYNAEIASEDFAALSDGGFVPVSAEDENNGAFTYVKRPYQSMIDHVYLSPNLAAGYGADGFFTVAAEKNFPNYIRDISDHRPIVFRLSVNGAEVASNNGSGTPEAALAGSDALERLKALLSGSAAGLENRRRPTRPATSEKLGFQSDFLAQKFPVYLPLPKDLDAAGVLIDSAATGIARYLLPYTHFSVLMNGKRRLPYFSAVNIDGNQLRSARRSSSWRFDRRLDERFQAGDELYRGNDLDRGHMTRRLDAVWGSPEVAERANQDTFYFTNSCPQHKNLNQREWSKLEDYVLDNTNTHDLKVSVMTGPIFGPNDPVYREVGLPEEFWKVVVIVNEETQKLSATGYILSQRDMISEFEFLFGEFKTYQVPLTKIAEKTNMDFGALLNSDPLGASRRGRGGFEAALPSGIRISGPNDIVI